MHRIVIVILCLFLIQSCKRKEKTNTKELFTVLNTDKTGINFSNTLKEDTYNNGFFYHYYYNGAGLAVADFNNDGLQDIYFLSNLESNKLFINQGDLKFKEVTKQSKVEGGKGFAVGVTVVDIDNDGFMDIYICKSGKTTSTALLKNELYINLGIDDKGVPLFKENAKKYGLDLPTNTTQASFFDCDKDGDLDVFLINHGQDTYPHNAKAELMKTKTNGGGEMLLKNNDGFFVDVTETSGIISNDLGYGLGVSVGDVNNDGWPDIYVAHDYSERDHLYLNNKNGTFKETALQSFGHVSNFSMGSDIADINNDGLLDIMSLDMMASDNYTQKTSMSGMNTKRFQDHVDLGLHHQYMYNALQINNGVDPNTNLPLFSDVAQMAGISSTDWSWAPLLLDMNNDGYKDLFVSNGIMRDFRNNDFKIYKKKKQQEAYDKGYLDKDAYMADMLEKMPKRKKKNMFYLNNKDLTFQPVEFSQPKSNSNGAAYADFDNDGDLDVIVNNSDGETFLYRNNSEKTNYLKVKLNGGQKNINALGTRVEVKCYGNSQIMENYFTRGYQSAMADDLHFGLGTHTKIDSIKVLWPDGKISIKTNAIVNQTITIDYESAIDKLDKKESLKTYLFNDITLQSSIDFKHSENTYDDFEKESLIPHKMSQQGPALAVADVNNDDLEDFYIGGAKGQSGVLYVQKPNGTFEKNAIEVFEKDKNHEDTGALFFDVDNDGDQDLYVVNGGNEEAPNSEYYKDRFYENLGSGTFKKNISAIPDFIVSGKAIAAGDYDNDGDLDLFVGSRVKPMHYGQYSKSYILENRTGKDNIKFVDVTEKIIPKLVAHTMVTDAVWVDINQDKQLDLIIANEWGPIEIFLNKDGQFINQTRVLGLDSDIGWWNTIAVNDIDNDGDLDIIAGNLGLNYKYKATKEAPFHLYLNDFDDNKQDDIVLGYNQNDTVYPLRGRECSSNQMPFIKEKFKTYNAFGRANLKEVYGVKLDKSIHYKATNFASGIFKNNGGKFEFALFENENQISSVNEVLVGDFNGSGNQDLVLLGNLYESEVETPRNDASYGHFLEGNKSGEYKNIPSVYTGLFISGNCKNASIIKLSKNGKTIKGLLIAKNNQNVVLVGINK